MARKNRKRHTGGYLIPVPLTVMLIVMAALSLCYLWLRARCDALGEELKAMEVRKASLQRVYLNEEFKLTNLKSPASLERALRRHNLVMAWPNRDQIVRLSDPDLGHALMYKELTKSSRRETLGKVLMND
jgi:hypothetical protein